MPSLDQKFVKWLNRGEPVRDREDVIAEQV
jgi:hypothetical protein